MIDTTGTLWTFWLAMLNHLWQGSLVLAALLLVDRLWRRSPAARRVDLWTLGVLKFLLPGSLGAWLLTRVSDPAAEVLAVPSVARVISPALTDTGAHADGAMIALSLVTALWVAGMSWGLWRLMADLRRQARFSRGAHPAAGPRWLAAATAAGVPRDRLLVAPAVCLPLVQGWWRPRILVPPHLLDALAPRELEALLRHEDGHRRGRDPLRLLLGRLATVVFWFFPPVTWLLGRLRECSEYAGDEAALATAGLDGRDYARALARAIRRGLDPAPPVAAAAGGGPDLLRRRLARLDRKEHALMFHGRLALTLAALVVAAAILFPLNLVADETPAPPPPPPPAVATDSVAPAPWRGCPAAAGQGHRVGGPGAAAEGAPREG